MGSGNTMCTSKRSTNDTRDIYMLEPRNRSKSHAKTKPILFRLVNCNYFLVQQILFIHINTAYRIVASTNTCYYSENQVFYSLE